MILFKYKGIYSRYAFIFGLLIVYSLLGVTKSNAIANSDRDASYQEGLFTVFIQIDKEGSKYSSGCTGVLLSEVMVATAAHCIFGGSKITVWQPGAKRSEIDNNLAESRVAVAHNYPKGYNDSGVVKDDIGVIIINKPFSKYSIAYLTNVVGEKKALEGELHSLGYGSDQNGKKPEVLKHGTFVHTKKFRYDENYEILGIGKFDNTMKVQTTICPGDSGGPLISYLDSKPILIGIASTTTSECNSSASSVDIGSWSRVNAYQDVFYLNTDYLKNSLGGNLYYSKNEGKKCDGNVYSNNIYLSGSLWSPCDLGLNKLELFYPNNKVEIRVESVKSENPKYYSTWESYIDNVTFSDSFEIYFYDVDSTTSNIDYDYKITKDILYDSNNNKICNTKSGKTENGFGISIENCKFAKDNYLITVSYKRSMSYDFKTGYYSFTSGNVDHIYSYIYGEFIVPFSKPNIAPAKLINYTEPAVAVILKPNPSSIEGILASNHCIDEYSLKLKKYVNNKCNKGFGYFLSFCSSEKSLNTFYYKGEVLAAKSMVNGKKDSKCGSSKITYYYSFTGKIFKEKIDYYVFMSKNGSKFTKRVYGY
jgi:V8-like Glu-specific endopeptidase